MHSIAAIILSAFLVQAHAEDFTQEDMDQFTEMLKDENTMDMVAEMMVDKLSAKLFGEVGRRAALAAIPIGALNLLPQNAQALSQFQNKQDTSRQEVKLPSKLDPAYIKREGGRKVKGWGNPYGDGGNNAAGSEPYGNKYPDVGNAIPSVDTVKINDNTGGKSFYVPPKPEALFGSDKYDNFKYGNKDPYTEAFDITKGAAGKQSDKAIFRKEELAESSPVVGICALAMISLVVGSGITFHVFRRRSSSLMSAKESLLA